MTEAELADIRWAGGLLDGEAHLRAIPNRKRPDYPRMHIGMTHQPTVLDVKKIFGLGRVLPQRIADKKGAAAWRWECNADEARQVLTLLLENNCIRTKKRDAEIVLALSDPSNTLSWEEKSVLREELWRINRRYVYEETTDTPPGEEIEPPE